MSCARHSKWLLAGVLFLIGVLVAEDALAQRGGRGGGGGRGGQGRNRNEREQETYSIVRVGDEIQAVLKDTVEDVAKSVKRENWSNRDWIVSTLRSFIVSYEKPSTL